MTSQPVVHNWQPFYSLLGSVSATMIGLLFVAVSVGHRLITRETTNRVNIVVTPIVLHFAALLVTAAAMIMPIGPRPWLIGELSAVAVIGLTCMVPVMLRLNRSLPDGEVSPTNLVLHGLLPILAYAGFGYAAMDISRHFDVALHILAYAAILMLVSNISAVWLLMLFAATENE